MKSMVSLVVVVVALVVVSQANSGKIRLGAEKTHKTTKVELSIDGQGPSDGNHLENYRRPNSDCVISARANLDQVELEGADDGSDEGVIKLTIKYLNGNLVGHVKVRSSNTVDSLKERIALYYCWWAPSMWLIYNTKSLENGRTIGSYNLQDGATIILFSWESKQYGDAKVTGMFWLENLHGGAYEKVHFQVSDTVANIRSWIESKFKAKTNCQYLMYDHHMLEDDKQTIDQLNVRNNSFVAWINIDSQCRQ